MSFIFKLLKDLVPGDILVKKDGHWEEIKNITSGERVKEHRTYMFFGYACNGKSMFELFEHQDGKFRVLR
jgi:hypothetical protein